MSSKSWYVPCDSALEWSVRPVMKVLLKIRRFNPEKDVENLSKATRAKIEEEAGSLGGFLKTPSRSTSTLPNLISDGVLRKPPKLPASSSIFARVALERFSTSFSGLKRRILSWTFITGLTDHSKAESHGTYHDFDDIDPEAAPARR